MSLLRAIAFMIVLTVPVVLSGCDQNVTPEKAYEFGVEATDAHNFHKARKWFERAADKGIEDAKFRLAGLRLIGLGGDEDPQAAAKVIKELAKSNHTKAQLLLARMYEKGIAVEEDKEKAVEFFEKAAKKGDPSAMHSLGSYYMRGEIYETDTSKGRAFVQRAARRGLKQAQMQLVSMYMMGIGGERNQEASYFWALVSNSAQNTTAQRIRELLEGRIDPETASAIRIAAATFEPITGPYTPEEDSTPDYSLDPQEQADEADESETGDKAETETETGDEAEAEAEDTAKTEAGDKAEAEAEVETKNKTE